MHNFSFELNGHMVEVFFVEPDHEVLGGFALGATIMEELKIFLNKKLPLTVVRSTFYHEFAHMAFFVSAGSVEDEDGAINEEIACNALGESFHQLMNQCHLMPKFLTTPIGSAKRALKNDKVIAKQLGDNRKRAGDSETVDKAVSRKGARGR